MNTRLLCLLLSVVMIVACSGRDDPDREAPVPEASQQVTLPHGTAVGAEGRPIDLGDVDSGIMINGTLAPEAQSDAVAADYIETMRGTLSMTTITVHPPYPEELSILFELVSTRAFEERPVVVRARAYRDQETPLGEEYASLMGKDAATIPVDAAGRLQPRQFVVDALEGLDAIPETMLLHVQADAWLMEAGTVEELIDPRTATSPERVTLLSNPVRINFVEPDPLP